MRRGYTIKLKWRMSSLNIYWRIASSNELMIFFYQATQRRRNSSRKSDIWNYFPSLSSQLRQLLSKQSFDKELMLVSTTMWLEFFTAERNLIHSQRWIIYSTKRITNGYWIVFGTTSWPMDSSVFIFEIMFIVQMRTLVWTRFWQLRCPPIMVCYFSSLYTR